MGAVVPGTHEAGDGGCSPPLSPAASTTPGATAPFLSVVQGGGFDAARALGCECDRCPLGPSGKQPSRPVLPEIRAGAVLYVIGEAPGGREVEQGAPFVGASGKLLEAALRSLGVHRGDVSLSNALLCRPPSEFRAYMKVLGVRNRKRKKEGKAAWPSPLDCCRPRVLREVAKARAVLTLGATAYASVTGAAADESGMMAARGYPQRWGARAQESR